MICPHCHKHCHPDQKDGGGFQDSMGTWTFLVEVCPGCNRGSVQLQLTTAHGKRQMKYPVWPRPTPAARTPPPPEVPKELASDYKEAALVLDTSPKAGAALSRRCLQHVLQEAAKAKAKDLYDQIEEVLPSVPSYLQQALHQVRLLGNFAAHPTKSKHTGEIIDVEPGEAEWLLDTLDLAFDFYFVQPALAKKKTADLNRKLVAAGKSPIK